MIQGSMVALVTPMQPDGSIDWDSLGALVDRHQKAGTSAIVAVGTSGESPTLNVDEHLQVIEFIVGRAAGKLPVIAGSGANSTAEAIELTYAAKRLGADYSLQVVPYYNKPTQEGLYQHFRTIAETVDIPQILYNVPGRTVADLQSETVLRLAEVDNIVAIKEATGDVDRAREILADRPNDFLVFSGDDFSATELMLAGGHGDISVTANVVPDLMIELCNAAVAGKRAEAEKLDSYLQPLNRVLFFESNPIPVKWALHLMGQIDSGIRLPLTPLSEGYRAEMAEVLTAMQLMQPANQ